jgi:hypothetical protein
MTGRSRRARHCAYPPPLVGRQGRCFDQPRTIISQVERYAIRACLVDQHNGAAKRKAQPKPRRKSIGGRTLHATVLDSQNTGPRAHARPKKKASLRRPRGIFQRCLAMLRRPCCAVPALFGRHLHFSGRRASGHRAVADPPSPVRSPPRKARTGFALWPVNPNGAFLPARTVHKA